MNKPSVIVPQVAEKQITQDFLILPIILCKKRWQWNHHQVQQSIVIVNQHDERRVWTSRAQLADHASRWNNVGYFYFKICFQMNNWRQKLIIKDGMLQSVKSSGEPKSVCTSLLSSVHVQALMYTKWHLVLSPVWQLKHFASRIKCEQMFYSRDRILDQEAVSKAEILLDRVFFLFVCFFCFK